MLDFHYVNEDMRINVHVIYNLERRTKWAKTFGAKRARCSSAAKQIGGKSFISDSSWLSSDEAGTFNTCSDEWCAREDAAPARQERYFDCEILLFTLTNDGSCSGSGGFPISHQVALRGGQNWWVDFSSSSVVALCQIERCFSSCTDQADAIYSGSVLDISVRT